MSDALKHECGIALVRLLKPLEYYYKGVYNPVSDGKASTAWTSLQVQARCRTRRAIY
jgi:hypothetical protein